MTFVFRDRPLYPWLNLPRLKGYSPGFTLESCDAERLGDGAVIEDDEDSVLGLLMAGRGKYALGSVASKERKHMKPHFPEKSVYMH